jgi:hypothetical protein
MIIDTIIDGGDFEWVYFDHETELDLPYREISSLNQCALQEKSGKGRHLHKKKADICAIRNGLVKVIVEVERKPTLEKVNRNIDIISKCWYLWAAGKLFRFDPLCVLYVVINNNEFRIPERVESSVGSLRWVVVCNKEEFPEKFKQHS